MARKAARSTGGCSPPGRVKIHFEPATEAQRTAVRAYRESHVVFFMGAAGTGKTHVAFALALEDLLYGRAERVVVTRPLVEAGEHLGFLPGSLEEKVDPWRWPVADVLGKMAYPVKEALARVDFVPLALMRGLTFTNTVAVLDEAQNATHAQFRLFLSRMGRGSKMVITGDPTQSDLPHGSSGLADASQRLDNLDGVGIVEFPDAQTVRHPLVAAILERLAPETSTD